MNSARQAISGIFAYIYCLQVYDLMYLIIEYFGLMNSLSKIYYYIVLTLALIACLLLIKYTFHFLSSRLDRSRLIYIIALVLFLLAFGIQFLGYHLGVSIGENISDLDTLSAPKTIKGQLNLVLHGAIVFLYRGIFGDSRILLQVKS